MMRWLPGTGACPVARGPRPHLHRDNRDHEAPQRVALHGRSHCEHAGAAMKGSLTDVLPG